MSGNANRGFTLVELMVALALGVFLSGSVIAMFSASRATSADAEALSRVQENIRFASDFLIRDVRNAGFNDVVELPVVAAGQVSARFVAIEANGTQMSVRYAGRGHCGERFTTYRAVQNTYFIAGGELRCTGAVWDGTNWQSADAVSLVSGLVGAQFDTVCQSGGTCNVICSISDADPCIGVRARFEFEGMRPLNAANGGVFTVELSAGLRNSIMEILYQNVIAGM